MIPTNVLNINFRNCYFSDYVLPCTKHVTFSLDFNGSAQCYQTLLDITDGFVLSKGMVPVEPAWTRSRSPSNRYVRWFRSASPKIEALTIAFGTLFISITLSILLYLRKKCNTSLFISHKYLLPINENS